jgi:hypothetical protein
MAGNFEARVWNTVNEMRHQIENNRREVSEQWENDVGYQDATQ